MFYKFHPNQTPSGLIPPTTAASVVPQIDPEVAPEAQSEPNPTPLESGLSRKDILKEAIIYLSSSTDPLDHRHLPFILALRHNISREEAAGIVYEAIQVLVSEGKLEDPEKLAAEQAAKLAVELEDELSDELGDADVVIKQSVLQRLIASIRGRR